MSICKREEEMKEVGEAGKKVEVRKEGEGKMEKGSGETNRGLVRNEQ